MNVSKHIDAQETVLEIVETKYQMLLHPLLWIRAMEKL